MYLLFALAQPLAFTVTRFILKNLQSSKNTQQTNCLMSYSAKLIQLLLFLYR